MNETTPLTDAAEYLEEFSEERSSAMTDDRPVYVVPADFARRLERALAGAKEVMQRIDSTAKSHPYAGNTCGELARAALAQIEELRK